MGDRIDLLFSSAVIFGNILNPDQDRQNVGPDCYPKCLTLMVFLVFVLLLLLLFLFFFLGGGGGGLVI